MNSDLPSEFDDLLTLPSLSSSPIPLTEQQSAAPPPPLPSFYASLFGAGQEPAASVLESRQLEDQHPGAREYREQDEPPPSPSPAARAVPQSLPSRPQHVNSRTTPQRSSVNEASHQNGSTKPTLLRMKKYRIPPIGDEPSDYTEMYSSSPIRGTREEKETQMAQKKMKWREREKELKAVRVQQEHEGFEAAERAARQVAAEEAHRADMETFTKAVQVLREGGKTVGDLIVYITDMKTDGGGETHPRWNGLFSIKERVPYILSRWSSGVIVNSVTGRRIMKNWVLETAGKILAYEANSITASGTLRSQDLDINETFTLGFSFDRLRRELAEYCPCTMQLLSAFATSTRQQRCMTDVAREKKERVSVTIIP